MKKRDHVTLEQHYTERPKTLWTQETRTPSVDRYMSAMREFRSSRVESRYSYDSYDGPAYNSFRKLAKVNPNEGFHRFEGRGDGCWGLVKDSILNDQTADLLAAADLLGGKQCSKGVSGPAGGFGLDTSDVWVALLDGGVGVEFHEGQDERTNRMQGWQRTTIRGPLAYRALLELLGFDWINRRLPGEKVTPRHDEISKLVNERLLK